MDCLLTESSVLSGRVSVNSSLLVNGDMGRTLVPVELSGLVTEVTFVATTASPSLLIPWWSDVRLR